ncbi:RNA-dependent RNA polymerase [Serbia mononega-like virus 1]|uniref:Replicase n=1 Tax=Serbia mononega-like virus 1 TaxID=2771455 RepID=A0A7H1C8Z5_9MONO|nr:RNA-dependent RNA polymerase [Serbia mononega-like virus 1]
MDHEDWLEEEGEENVHDADESDESDEDETRRKTSDNRYVSMVPGHLASAIYSTEVEMIVDDILHNEPSKMRCPRHTKIIGRFKDMIKNSNLRLVSIYDHAKDPMEYITKWASGTAVDEEKIQKEFNLCIASIENVVVHKAHFLQPLYDSVHNKAEMMKKLNKQFDELSIKLLCLLPEFREMKKAEIVKDEVCYTEIESGDFNFFRGMHVERDLTYIVEGGCLVLIPTTLFLCAIDKMQCEFGLLLTWRISDINNKYPGRSIEGAGRKIMQELKTLRREMGQDFFSFVGCWEALMVGWTVGSTDDLGCLELFVTQSKEMMDLLDAHNVDRKVMRMLLPPDRSNDSVLMGLELVGMSKIFGYPTLVIEKLLDQIKEYGTVNKYEIDSTIITELSAVARRDFLFQYRKKKGHYPPVLSCPRELNWIKKNRKFRPRFNKEYGLWSQVRFKKCLDFNYCPDASELVKDSSTATNSSAWSDMYDRCAFYMRYNRGYPKHQKGKRIYTSRTIEHYLQADEDEVRKLVEDRDAGIINREDMICVECGKECEMKVECGRAFTKQTPPQRLIQTVMELNIADGIFPYVPQQSMIDGEIRNTRRILDQVKLLQEGCHFISLDLKKWCLFQRHESTSFMGEMYDELFGFKQLYKNSHLFFNSSRIFTNHRLAPPDFDHNGNPVRGDLFLDNFIGGMEGMQQKKWTHITECLIQLTLEKCELSGEIMGQGDNQVILLKFHPTDTSSEVKRTNFLISLDTNFKRINHELKEKETWYSRHLHEYSKQRVYKGIAVSNATKKACRIMPDINDGLFSITSCCATINTITEGIARADYNADVAFAVNQFMMTNYLLRKGIISCGLGRGNDTDTVMRARAMLMSPADFGGLPLSSYYTHTVRGNDDKVTLWLSIAQTLRTVDRPLYLATLSLWQEIREPSLEPLSMKRLIEDVYAISVSTLPSSEKKIREMTMKYLTSGVVTNPSIKKLYEKDVSQSYDDLIIALSSMRPMFPQLAHEILKNSNAGTLLQLQNKLTSTKTIEKVVSSQMEDTSLVQLILKQNMDITRTLKSRKISDPLGLYYTLLEEETCPCKIADTLRTKGWGIQIVGVTKSVFQHQAKIFSYDHLPGEWRNRGITVRLSDEIIRSPRDCYKRYGKMNPYIGSQTKEKIKKATVSVIEKTSYVKSLLRLGKLRSWCSHLRSKNLMALIASLMEEKRSLISNIPEDVEDLQDLCATITSGNPYHRMKSEIDHDTAMINCLPSITGHFEHDSNTFKGLTIGGKDYSVFFQLNYISNIACLALAGFMTEVQCPQYMMVFPCEYCSGECPSPTIDLEQQSPVTPLLPASVSEELTLTPNINLDDTRMGMSTKVGRDFARNIDKNFTLHHEKGVGDHSSKEFESFVVSLNDLRVLDLKMILDVAFLHSNHVKALYRQNKPTLRCINEDKSFLYLAERIIQAGLLEVLIEIMDLKLTSHSSVTTFSGLSTAISANVISYLKRSQSVVVRALNISFFQDGDDYSHLDATRFGFSILTDTGRLDQRTLPYLNTVLAKGRAILARMRLSPGHKLLPLEEADMITVWRSFDRSTLDQPSFVPRPAFRYTTRSPFPHDEISAYQVTRSTCTHVKPIGALKCLSFLARPSGYISSAPNKFIETIVRLGLDQLLSQDNRALYCLAEGSGSTFDTLMKMFPNISSAYYNTLMLPGVSNRDVPSSVLPPALVAGRTDQSKLKGVVELAMGTTDILDDTFLEKLGKCMTDDPPLIVTIDAESPDRSNNLMFVDITVKSILKYSPAVVICKVFFLYDFENQIKAIIEDESDEYKCFFYKPISSNPTGPEVYLVVVRSDYVTQECVRSDANWNQTKGYLGREMAMSYNSLRSYCTIAKKVAGYIFNLTSQSMPNKYHNLIPDSCCSILCPKLYRALVGVIFDLHTHNEEEGILVTIRRKGTSQKIHSVMQEFVFLTIYLTNRHKPISTIIEKLFTVGLNSERIKEWRKNPRCPYLTVSAAGGNYLHEWYDVRMYLRETSISRGCLQRCRVGEKVPIRRNNLCSRMVSEMIYLGVLERENVFHRNFAVED